jgi:hypothetical protein
MFHKMYICYVSIASILALTACDNFLDEKASKRISTTTSVGDFQALLNNYGILNANFISAGDVSSDDFYLSDQDYNGLIYDSDKRLYTWQPDYVTRPQSSSGDEWYNTYRAIYISNSVLKGIEENNFKGELANNIRGQALVFRAARYLDGVQVWCKAYHEEHSETDLGMVLRLDPDMNLPSTRASVKETYEQIAIDLKEAIELLPAKQSSVTLPSKAAAAGLLARTYLLMAKYEGAADYAKMALKYKSTLINFNNLDSTKSYTIPLVDEVSEETVFYNFMFFAAPTSASVAKISPHLLSMYKVGDLRKTMYFATNNDGSKRFRGSHSGGSANASGVTVGELYLILSESLAQTNRLDEAAEVLNTLLLKRWTSGSFTPLKFLNRQQALDIIWAERRKELVFRGLRWGDIKRLNTAGAQISLTRTNSGSTYSLPSNDLRFAIAIPEDVISISGIPQNPR